MAFKLNLLGMFLLLLFVIHIQSKPVSEIDRNNVNTLKLETKDGGEEMMETAESQNPFLPRFTMLRLKERRAQARAQRRSQAQRRENMPRAQPHQAPCPQQNIPIYKRYYASH